MFTTIHFEELPLHVEHSTVTALRPSSIEEDEDDPRSLLYLFDDNDFERAAAFWAVEEARHQAQAAAQALAQAEAQQRRTRALAGRLRQLLDEDDELIDLLGRRILATNGYQVPDLWQPPHNYHAYGSHSHPYYPYHALGSQHASSSRGSSTAYLAHPYRSFDAHAMWDPSAEPTNRMEYARASPFIHAAPLILNGHAPYQPKAARRHVVTSSSAADPSQASSRALQTPTQTRIAIHPLTGVPMLLVEPDSVRDKSSSSSSRQAMAPELGGQSDDEADEWSVEDESDLDWLGLELLRRRGGADVWVLGTDDSSASTSASPSSTSQAAISSLPATTASSAAAMAEKSSPAADPTHPVEVEEVDSDHELASVARALDPNRNDGVSSLSSPSQRVAAALARAAMSSPRPAHQAHSAQPRRQRAATVMSESEEEELETVGRPVVESDTERGDPHDDASSLSDRPRKSVKVVDLR